MAAKQPIIINLTSHGLENEDVIWIQDVVGLTDINNKWFRVSDAETNSFKIKIFASDEYKTSDQVYVSGGQVLKI